MNFRVKEFTVKNTPKKNLIPKGQRSFLSKNGSNLPFLAQEAQTKKKKNFAILTIRSSPRLLGEHVQNISKKLTPRIVRL
jgi:hypothetical protein